MQALVLPSHRASKKAALDWLAVQGLNARGRSATSEEVKIMARTKTPWLFDSTPRTAPAAAAVSLARRGLNPPATAREAPPSSPFEWLDAPPREYSQRDDVAFRRRANRKDAWTAELARDTRWGSRGTVRHLNHLGEQNAGKVGGCIE